MNAIERRQYEMLVRVRDFGHTYGHLFPATSVARQDFATIAAAISKLDAHDLTHMAASVSARADSKTGAREALRARVQAISQTARVLAEGGAPGLDSQFEVPAPLTDQTLLTTGRKFARDVEPFSSQFVMRGMAATFVPDLTALVDGFERALRDRGLGREARRAARESTKAAMLSGLAAVRSLNAIVTNHLRDDTVTSAVWERDRRIVYPERGKRTDTVQNVQDAAPTAGTSESPTGTRAA
jgi:hypothetical protein